MYPTAPLSGRTYVARLLCTGWAQLVKLHGGEIKTAAILRYTTSAAGSPAAGVAPTKTLVAGLTGLPVVSDPNGPDTLLRRRSGSEEQLKEAHFLFIFNAIPATTGVAANTILGTDVILFEGCKYAPVDNGINNNYTSGLSYALCRMIDRA